MVRNEFGNFYGADTNSFMGTWVKDGDSIHLVGIEVSSPNTKTDDIGIIETVTPPDSTRTQPLDYETLVQLSKEGCIVLHTVILADACWGKYDTEVLVRLTGEKRGEILTFPQTS